MADQKISDLTQNPSITGLEELPSERDGANFKQTIDEVKTFILADVPASGVATVTGDGVGGTATDVVMAFPTPTEIGALQQGANTLTADLVLARSGSRDVTFSMTDRRFLLCSDNGGVEFSEISADDAGWYLDNISASGLLSVEAYGSQEVISIYNTYGNGIKFSDRAIDEVNVDFATDDDNLLSIGKAKENLPSKAEVNAKADKATLTQSGGNVTGSIDTDANTFSLTSTGGGGGGDVIEGNTESLRAGSTSGFGLFDYNTIIGLGGAEGLGAWATGFGNLVKVPQAATYVGYQMGNLSRQSNSTALGSRIQNIGKGATYIGYSIDDLSADKSNANYNSIVIGRNNALDATNHRNSISIGSNQVLGNGQELFQTTLIGDSASSMVDPDFGTDGTDNTGIGYESKPHSWRATAIGAYAYGAAVSTTCIGMGSYANQSHGVTIGRGGYNDTINSVVLYTGSAQMATYFGSQHAAFTNPAMPLTETKSFATELNNGTFVATFTTCDGKDVRPTPLLTDTRGGSVQVAGGIGTGTANGGDVLLSTSPADISGGNNLNSLEVAVKIDASKNVDTRFFLLDVTDGTLKRVEFGDDDSAGVGFKTLKIAN